MRYWDKGDELNNGKFIVEQLLGSGGFGVTYKIKRTRTNKLFALKTLNIEAQNRSDFQQLQVKFINEAIALASCRHPNIVRVYPQGFREGKLWCMVMEYVEGEDLDRYLDKNGKLAESKAIAIITKVGNALSFVHQQGLLHRDIKPANILLRSSDLTPVLIDFGLAREFISQQSMSMTNSRTESFAPIEQYQRQGNFGPWTDVYALAATLYVLLTDRLPLPAKFRQETEYDLTPPQKYEPQISERVNEAIVKGMEIEPGDRPSSVKEWLDLLTPSQPKAKPQPKPAPTYVPESYQHISVTSPVSPTPSRTDRSTQVTENSNSAVSVPITRRNWLKYSGLAISTVVVTSIGKSIWDNVSQPTAEIDSPEESDSISSITNSKPESTSSEKVNTNLSEYKFDVITVNDRGEEINREEGRAKYFTEDLGNGITLEMVEIPGGTFMMGSPEDEKGRNDDEDPQHRVTVSSFYIAKSLVTQEQWKAVAQLPQVEIKLELDPSNFKGDNLPVESVSWNDAVEFGERLSKKTGREYRLPSEAEWEYAARAKTTTPFHFGETITTNLANYKGNYTYANEPKGKYRERTTPVGSFPPNAFGLYDLHGLVWEWCADVYHENYQGAPNDGSAWVSGKSSKYVVRGGSWDYDPVPCRSANRAWNNPDLIFNNSGFRCVVPRTV